jgi:hypothetical protein
MQFPDQWDDTHDTCQQTVTHNQKRKKRRREIAIADNCVDVRDEVQPQTKPQTTPQTHAACDNVHMHDVDTEKVDTEKVDTEIVDTSMVHTMMRMGTAVATPPDEIVKIQMNAALGNVQQTCAPIYLSLHSLISRVPFKEMMHQMFTDDMLHKKEVPIVTKAYEESFLREPMFAHEKSCVCGDNCEFNFIDIVHPFVGVEFKLQHCDDSQPQMCVLCSRKLTQELFYKMVYGGERFLGFIQRYGNLCQQPGEYARESVLVCPKDGPVSNMPLPIVAHQRHKYSVFMQHGVKYLKQHNVSFEDFQNASSSVP